MYHNTFMAEQDARLRREEDWRQAAERTRLREARLLLGQTGADRRMTRLIQLLRRLKRTPAAQTATGGAAGS